MEEHILFYVDLLGTKAAIEGSDPAKIQGLEELLKNIGSLRRPFALTSKQGLAGQVAAIEVKPEVTTFSDHIVLSLPTTALRSSFQDAYIPLGVIFILSYIGSLAAQAVKLDLLIRGGAAIGELHHENGVVLGKALVEAYELESRIANYPRIAVSRKLALLYNIVTDRQHSGFASGVDGIKHAEYIGEMLLQGGNPQEFLAEIRDKVAKNITAFEAAERWSEMSKWAWFGSEVERVVDRLSIAK